MATKLATPQNIDSPVTPLTPEQKRQNAVALAKQEAARKKEETSKPINPKFTQEPSKPFAKGGSVTRGDGCAQRGHTKGKNR